MYLYLLPIALSFEAFPTVFSAYGVELSEAPR